MPRKRPSRARAATPQPSPGPGEQQPDETAPAFEAFRIYLEMGPQRSTDKVRRKLGKSKRLIEKWSSRHQWQRRVREFEAEATKRIDEAHMDEIAKRSRQQARIAQLHGDASAIVPREILRRLADPARADEELRSLTTAQLLALEATLARSHHRSVVTERLALGMTTDQPGEPLPRSEAEEQARRMSDAELDSRLSGIDELAVKRETKRRRAEAATG